jgi:hypothetical protein
LGREMLPKEGYVWGNTWKVKKHMKANASDFGVKLKVCRHKGGQLFEWDQAVEAPIL